jgi:hypothetical protein
VTDHLVVATANILRTLRARDARAALVGVLEHEPDLVGLQEWGLRRAALLRATRDRRPPYLWTNPVLGGNAVGARADRFELVERRGRTLAGVARADLGARPVPVMPPRVATVAVLRDLRRDRVVTLLNYHLVPGVQARGRYREDRPLLVARHRAEVAALGRIVAEQLALGREVHAVGDSNFDGLRLPGLTSAWEGRPGGPGTFGSAGRKIDDVHGPGPASSVELLDNPSDHRALLVTRPL